MRRSVVNVLMGLLAVVMFGICGCGSGGDAATLPLAIHCNTPQSMVARLPPLDILR